MARYLNHSCDVIIFIKYSPIAKPRYNLLITNRKYSYTQLGKSNSSKNLLMTISSVLTQTKNLPVLVEPKIVRVGSIDKLININNRH